MPAARFFVFSRLLKTIPPLLALTLALLPALALAHRVNIFAWTEGDQIVVECAFNGSSKVNGGRIAVYDAVDGKELLQGITDAQGQFRFAVPDEARAAGHDLRIQINAGEGHQNQWIVEASEFNAAPTAAASFSPAPGSADVAVAPSSAQGAGALPGPCATPADVRRIVNAALDAKLAPLKRDLAAQRSAGPGLTEIIGGLGWLLGLAGLGLYFRGRRG
ncbi:cobalamin biosynthesis protein CbiL [Desulfovibrio sp. ZJ369]|uniref:cobalamin biosynthesis protein CbiL n=1 Tax=Desulfovibrio sp. ZJ369 TaxID=2709793 RepID=UPI001F14E8AA|nr:cobalamin biosynthesis protein CbiL [Desulfovibrio sp. ZJ369]